MSMIGFAARPGTDVEPVCSRVMTRSPRIDRIRAASRSNNAGQRGSDSTMVIGPVSGFRTSTVNAWISASVWKRGPGGRREGSLGWSVIDGLLGFGQRPNLADRGGRSRPDPVVAFPALRDGEVA